MLTNELIARVHNNLIAAQAFETVEVRELHPTSAAWCSDYPFHQRQNVEWLTCADRHAPVQGPMFWMEQPDARTEADEVVARLELDPDKIDLVNKDTVPDMDPHLRISIAAARWAWAGLRVLPHIAQLDFVRESLLRDLVYMATRNADWMQSRCDGLAAQLLAAARMDDGTEIAMQQVQQLEEQITASEEQLADWTDVARGFKSAHKRYMSLTSRDPDGGFNVDREGLPEAWGSMKRGVRIDHVKRWALRFREVVDAPDGLADRLHERVFWALCNMANRNARYAAEKHAEAKTGAATRKWRLQLDAWRGVLAPAFEAAYRVASPGSVFTPAAARTQDASHQRSEVVRWTAAEIAAKYQHIAAKSVTSARAQLEQYEGLTHEAKGRTARQAA